LTSSASFIAIRYSTCILTKYSLDSSTSLGVNPLATIALATIDSSTSYLIASSSVVILTTSYIILLYFRVLQGGQLFLYTALLFATRVHCQRLDQLFALDHFVGFARLYYLAPTAQHHRLGRHFAIARQ